MSVYNRRLNLSVIFIALVFLVGVIPGQAADATIKIGITPVFLNDRTAFVEEWRDYLAQRLGRPVEFEQRKSYREVTELLLAGELDAAWLCGYPFTRNSESVKLLGVPIYDGKPLYQSYLIVPATDTSSRSIMDLKRKVFAFSDPDSNSGYLSPQVDLIRNGITPKYFFGKTFFTWSHRNVVEAVADGLAQGGAVDGYIWDTLSLTNRELIAQTRIVSKSDYFGFPPLVTSNDIDPGLERDLRQAFYGMHEDPGGRRLLKKLNLDRFARADDKLYDSIREMAALLESNQ
jgi:phosphonate transport system substrate-binding protein